MSVKEQKDKWCDTQFQIGAMLAIVLVLNLFLLYKAVFKGGRQAPSVSSLIEVLPASSTIAPAAYDAFSFDTVLEIHVPVDQSASLFRHLSESLPLASQHLPVRYVIVVSTPAVPDTCSSSTVAGP